MVGDVQEFAQGQDKVPMTAVDALLGEQREGNEKMFHVLREDFERSVSDVDTLAAALRAARLRAQVLGAAVSVLDRPMPDEPEDEEPSNPRADHYSDVAHGRR